MDLNQRAQRVLFGRPESQELQVDEVSRCVGFLKRQGLSAFRALIGHNLFFLGKLSMAYDANGEEQPGQSSNRNVV